MKTCAAGCVPAAHELCSLVQGVAPTAEMAGDPDIFGAQQYAPLLDIEIPAEPPALDDIRKTA